MRSICAFTFNDLVDIYNELFYLRPGMYVNGVSEMKAFMKVTNQHWYGNVLLFRNVPCAFQLIMKVTDPNNIYYDYINVGLNS